MANARAANMFHCGQSIFFGPFVGIFLSISFSFYHSSTCNQIQSISESCQHSHRFGSFIGSLFGTLSSVQNRCHDTFNQMPCAVDCGRHRFVGIYLAFRFLPTTHPHVIKFKAYRRVVCIAIDADNSPVPFKL